MSGLEIPKNQIFSINVWNRGRKIYTLIFSSDSEFKNFRINENYESLYKEIVKFCIKNEIEYELV